MKKKTTPEKPLRVYIAGPFSGRTAWDVELNVRRAELLSLFVAQAGHHPFCPHTQGRHFKGQLREAFWIEWGLSWLHQCDVVALVMRKYSRSKGTVGEVELAEQLKIPVLMSPPEEQWGFDAWHPDDIRDALADPRAWDEKRGHASEHPY